MDTYGRWSIPSRHRKTQTMVRVKATASSFQKEKLVQQVQKYWNAVCNFYTFILILYVLCMSSTVTNLVLYFHLGKKKWRRMGDGGEGERSACV